MAKKKNSAPAAEKSLFDKISEQATHLKEEIIHGKDLLVEAATEKIADIKESIAAYKAKKKPPAKKTVKKVVKKVAKKPVVKAAKKAVPTVEKKIAPKKAAPAKNKAAAKKTASVKKVAKKAIPKKAISAQAMYYIKKNGNN
jgi:hypothetical protein